MKKKIFRWVKIFVLLYAVIGIAWFYGQEKLLFHPMAVDRHTRYDFGQPFTEVNLNVDKETNLNIIEFKIVGSPLSHDSLTSSSNPSTASPAQNSPSPASSASSPGLTAPAFPSGAASIQTTSPRPALPDSLAKGVVLYFHGNKDNIARYAKYATDFTRNGYEVWMPDYPGYGKSTGPFTEKNLHAQALLLYKLARSRWKPSQIILYGKSLGTGVAAQLASVRDCRRLILETPYYSMTSVFRRYLFLYPVGTMLHYHFPTNEYLPDVTAPITIFHGTSDGVIPYSNAARLQALLKPGDEFITIDGGSHNDLHQFPLFTEKLDSVLHQ